MYVITITNIDHNLLEVEVSVDVYKVYEDSRRQEERQRYERRKGPLTTACFLNWRRSLWNKPMNV